MSMRAKFSKSTTWHSKYPKTASEAVHQSKKLKALPHFAITRIHLKQTLFKDDVSAICECCKGNGIPQEHKPKSLKLADAKTLSNE